MLCSSVEPTSTPSASREDEGPASGMLTFLRADFAKTKQPQRDEKLSDLLQSATYLEPSSQPIEGLDRVPLITDDLAAPPSPGQLPLPPVPPLEKYTSPVLVSPAVQTFAAGQSIAEGEPPKKKKAVKFAFVE